jgi:hypothetical protein
LHSSQQDLDLRTTVGGGYGRYLKRTGTSQFRWLGGVAYTKEVFTTLTRAGDSNAEGLIGLAYDSFRFKVGEIHLKVLVFPGLSDFGRVRSTPQQFARYQTNEQFSSDLLVLGQLR